MNKLDKIILTLLILLLPCALTAEQTVRQNSGIRVEGRKNVILNHKDIRLSDIAEISSGSASDDDTIIALKKIVVDPAPQPVQQATISASRILERLKEEGVKLSEIVYIIPRITTVSRASRELTLSEIESALREVLKSDGMEVTLKEINYKEPIKVPPSFGNLRAEVFKSAKSGEINFTVTGYAQGEDELNYNFSAKIDQWVNIPIASQYLAKGSKINPSDISMARMNIASLPTDTFHSTDDIVGKEVTHDIQYGESFRKNKLNIPPAILAGSKVMLVYKSGALEATASGIAQEAGMPGQEIRVRNDTSKKIVIGKVIEPGKVGVNQ